MARPILYRSLTQLYDEKFTDKDIKSFFICFCKQCMNMSPEVVTDHAYMYYFLYYCVMLDGDKSDKFRNNLLEVIKNVNARNKFL